MNTGGRPEAGSATIYVLAGCLLVGLAALVPIVSGGVALARHRAGVAADAAALAGADSADAGELAQGTTSAQAALVRQGCLRAAAVARDNRATLASCNLVRCGRGAVSLQVTVRETVTWAGVTLPEGRVEMPARAGDEHCLAKSLP